LINYNSDVPNTKVKNYKIIKTISLQEIKKPGGGGHGNHDAPA
jgi:hypothetical protein